MKEMIPQDESDEHSAVLELRAGIHMMYDYTPSVFREENWS